MTTEFREEWRRWNEEQIEEVAAQVHRMATKVKVSRRMFCAENKREPTLAEIRLRNTFNGHLGWVRHEFGLNESELLTLAHAGTLRDHNCPLDLDNRYQAYRQRCREIADDWLWNTMQAEVSTDKIELPTDFLASQ